MGGSALSARLSRSRDSEQTVLLGAALTAAAAGVIWLSVTVFEPSVVMLALPMTFYSIGMGLVLPNSMAVALRHFPHIAGTASALMGFIQMALSAVASALVGAVLKDSPAPMVNSMLLITLLALALSVVLYRRREVANTPASTTTSTTTKP
jgi:DHA1 family bicyclomycin/chloramphenicol resistance-like MFS transporter